MSNPEFIETQGSLERIDKVLDAIRSGNPILLEGETGTSKTRTAIVASQKNGQEPIVLNFSSQTTIDDIIGRISKDTDSWGGFSFINGPFTDAFMNGHCLILDEINLAYENVLQCIEAALDSGKLFLEISGSETKVVQKHQNFHLIATQNPLTGRFSQKRQFLSQKFRSRFQTITFVDIEKDELYEIAMGLAKGLPNSKDIIPKLIEFHFNWKKKEANENQIHVFTIREISGTIKSMKEGLSLFESISIHYGSRYDIGKLEQMKDMLESMGINRTDTSLILPEYDQNLFYMTNSLKRSLLNSSHLLQTCHPILITGPDGCGKTSFARWIAQIYNSNKIISEEEEKKAENEPDNKNENPELPAKEETTNDNSDNQNDNQELTDQEPKPETDEQKETLNSTNNKKEKISSETKQKDLKSSTNVFICNPEVSISDIIGRYTPIMVESGEAPIQWIDGPVVASLRKGDCLIMDQIDTAPSTILERLNSLYDNFGIKDAKFPVQENSEEENVLIHPNFRIIATSSYEGLVDISPALLNRFTIIYVDDQLAELFSDKSKLNQFIQHLSPTSPLKSDIKLITEQVIRNRENMTISRISMIVKGFFSIKNAFPRAVSKSVLEFCISATSSSTDLPIMDANLVSLLLSSLREDSGDSTFDSFIFKEASATRQIMAILVAAFIAGFHVVLIGKTGLGKTSAAIALSRLCQFSQGRQFISFNGETQLEELFGYFTIEKGNFTSHSGPLSDAMENGKIFIADELNLADQMIIQSLNVAIEPSKNDQIILPVIGRNIAVNERFFFIGCQNDVSMYGRKPLPPQFQKKVLCIKYPENSREDLLSLTKSLATQFDLKSEYSLGTTEVIQMMKQDSIFQKKVWSLREVRRLFRRTSYISKHSNSMMGFDICANAAFLLRSAFRDTEGITEKVVGLISRAFKLSKMQSENLANNLSAEVKVFKIEAKSQIQLKKNRLSLTITNSELLKIPEELQSFWQTLFEIGITHPSEPLLLVGPSGFKTFLAKAVCPRSPVVYLHSDTTISSLIGQITLLDKDQAKNFLMDSLYNFAGPAPPDEFQVLFQEIRDLEIIDIEKIQEVKKFINVSSFNNIVDNIIQQLIDIDNQHDTESAFSNYYSVFKPGLITKYILKQDSLILRNIAQPSPTVLERLNELLSVTPTLTLFEDTSNTITPLNDKILSQFSSNFRIIGICLPREKRGLSEAMLSRLTEISVPKYTNQDQEKVIDSILLQSELNSDSSFGFYKKLLSTVGQIFIDHKEELSMSIPFTRIIEIVRISIEWRTLFNKYNKAIKEELLFSLALFRCAAGPLPYEIKKEFLRIFYNEETGLIINEELRKLFEDKIDEQITPHDFLRLEEDDQTFIRSTISTIFMPSPLNRIPDANFCFTSSTKDMIDVVISASAINYPLILEGPNGSGKSSVVFYLSKCVDANIVRISISSSTTVEDLFGKYEPNTSSKSLKFDFQPTDFLNAIRYDNDSTSEDFSPLKKQWIIIEELHLASPSVLDSLAPIFNKQTDQIFLTDGQVVAKRDYFIVGLISQPLQNQSIINSSMVYKTRDYTKQEYDQIYKYILSNNDFNEDECSYFSDQMYILSQLSLSSQVKTPITVREVYKFLNLFEGSEGNMENKNIIRILCLGRFTNNEFIENAKAELNYNDDDYTLPTISVEMGSSTLKSGGIPMRINASTSKSSYETMYLSSSEKELFVFLSMSLKKYTPIIIQGPTASGKTYSVQLFADILGKTLRTIQLNSEISSQTISGTFQPSKNLSVAELEKLQNALHSISDLPNLPQKYADKIQNNDINNWNPKDFKELRTTLQEIMNDFNEVDKEKASAFIKEVNNLLKFYNHLKRSESVVIKAMIEGSWLLLDGIEAAPPDFFDRLSTLIDNNPTLNLYERGNGFSYSKDSLNPEFRIHPDFRLIMTYNPVDINSANNLSPSLLSRCTIFSMKSIDSNLNDSSLVIFGFLNQIDFKHMDEDSSEISIKLGKSHMTAKEFTSNSQFFITGRTLIHLCHNLVYKSSLKDYEINFENLKKIIDYIYGSSIDKPDEFLEAVEEKFEQTIDINIREFIKKAQLSTSKGCIEIINLINNFIIDIKESTQTKFDFESFLGWLLQLHLKDIEIVYDKVRYILINCLKQMMFDIIKNNNNFSTADKNLFAHSSAIRCLEILVNEIRQTCQDSSDNEFSKNMTLNSPQILEIPKFKIIIKKIRCLLYLIQNEIFIKQSLPILFFDNTRKEFLSIFEKIEEQKPLQEIFDSVKELKDNEDSKNLINFSENPIFFLDSMIHFNDSYNWPTKLNTVSKMISSCLFFNDNNCKYLFKGISRVFYLILESFLNDESDINLFVDLIEFVTFFYNALEIKSSIALDEFISLFEERSNDQTQFTKFFQNLRSINNRLSIQKDHIPVNEIEEIKPIASAINSLYLDYNEKYGRLYLQGQKDQEAAKEFLQIVEKINNRLETEKVLKVPFELYVVLTHNLEINAEKFAFLKEIYLSIKEPKETKINTFEWPHDHKIKFSEETPSFPLIESLIKYSKKEQIDLHSANWMTLCSIEKNTEYFLNQFLNKSISQESIHLYQTIIKAQLLYELSNIPEDENTKKYEYCAKNAIVDFFNNVSNRSAKVNQKYIDLAHFYELNMDKDFVISIPTFDLEDVISLLINPIDLTPGPLFTDVSINYDDVQFLQNHYDDFKTKSFYDLTILYLSENGIKIPDIKSFDDIYSYVASKNAIKNHAQDMVKAFFIADQILKVVASKANQRSRKLQFYDVPNEFNVDFIDKNPFCGFYLALHPEVKPEIDRIRKLADESSFPLSLFAFRLYSNQDIVEIKLPTTFTSDINQDIEDFISQISNVIITNYKNKNITKFSNLLGFLLDEVPIALNTQKSEHFREILLDLMSKPQSPILLKYIIRYLHKNIEQMVLIIGSAKWEELINADFIKKNDDFLNFLMNPWEKVLKSIENEFKEEKKQFDENTRTILELISNQFSTKYNNRGFFNQIFDAKTKDEFELQTKIREEYKRVDEQLKDNSLKTSVNSDTNKAWMAYCGYVVNAMNQINEFPSVSNGKFPNSGFYEEFHKFFLENSSFSHPLSDAKVTFIVFVLKENLKNDKDKKKIATISYTKGKQTVKVSGEIINNISIMKLPSKLSVKDLNLNSSEVDIYYDNAYYDSSAHPQKSFSIKNMKDKFAEFKKQLQELNSNNDKNDDNDASIAKKFGNIEVLFNNHKYNEFKEKIQEFTTDITQSISKSGSLKYYSDLPKTILTKIKEIEDYFPISFVDKSVIPKNTTESLDQFVNFISKTKQSLNLINIPDEIIEADEEFVINKQSEFQNILKCVKTPTPVITDGTTQYKPNEIICNDSDKLIVPTIFIDGSDFCINITRLSAKLGPFYKGYSYSHLIFRIINLTKQKIKCTFQQDNQIIDLLYENKEGFFNLLFPIDKIPFNYDDDSEISFTGTISFYEIDSETSFKEVPYDITLCFLSPNIYLNIQNQSFAIKDGDAKILPYYSVQNSNIDIKVIPYFRQLKYIELPNNTCKKPSAPKIINKNIVSLSLPSIIKDEDCLSMQLDFGLSYNMPALVTLNTTLREDFFSASIYCDDKKDFLEKDAKVVIGNSWRDMHILISYYNGKSSEASADLTFQYLESKNYEISKPKPIKFKPYSQNVEVICVKVRTIGKDYKRGFVQNSLTIIIGTLKATIDFSFYLNFININKTDNNIYTNKYLGKCSYWDGNSFKDYNYKEGYERRDLDLILAPDCLYIYQKNSNNVGLKYDDDGVLTNIYDNFANQNQVLYEIFTLIEDPSNKLLQIQIITKRKVKQKNGQLRLFARIKGKPNTVFPLFGECKKIENKFDASTFNYDDHEHSYTNEFIMWFEQFLDEPNKIISSSGNKFNFNEGYVKDNFGYLIKFMVKNYNKIPYKDLPGDIKKFTNSDTIIEKYESAFRGFNILEWKLISIVWALSETMLIKYRDLSARHFIVDFPIPLKIVQEEQERLCKKCNIDIESMKKTNEFTNMTQEIKQAIQSYNDKQLYNFEKKKFEITHFAKWSFINKFQKISESEFPKTKTTNEFKDIIQPEYSKEAGNIDISSTSFEKMNSLKNIYETFDSILRNTYQFSISLHSCLKKNKEKKNIVGILNQLVSFFLWAKDIKDYSPYPTFFDRFFSAYQSMMTRLRSSGINIRPVHSGLDLILTNNEFVIKPDYTHKNLDIVQFTQPGKNKAKPQDDGSKKTKETKHPKKKLDDSQFYYRPDSTSTPEYDETKKFVSPLTQGHGRNPIRGEVIQKISRESINDASKEIPNKDYINYVVNKMVNPTKENKFIELFNDQKSHIPQNYLTNPSDMPSDCVNYYFDAADSLTGIILDGLSNKPEVLNNCDNCYSSILIDCSNTFSEIQKSSLILLSIAFGNALTALRIPYSIVIYCDDNFQIILKKLEDVHDKLYFAKLIESMTINRRMSSMTDAIQMAKQKVSPSKSGQYANRTNHVIYVLSDGLSTLLDKTDQWNATILNDKLVTVSFFFLNIISGDFTQAVLDVWSKFANGISKADSPSTVFYSTFDNILENKEFYSVLGSGSQKQDSISQLVSLSECFGKPIMQSVSQVKTRHSKGIKLLKEPKKLASFYFDTNMVNPILNLLNTPYSNEKKYYRDASDPIPLDDPLDVEIYEMKVEPFSTNLNTNETQKSRELISTFYKKLFELSSEMTDSTSIQELASYVFVPNKPSQYVPSSDGTLFYFPGLIRFLLTQGQDTKIFLEKKAGLLKSYSVFIVIDCSISCFNVQSAFHAFQSIFILLQSLSKIDLPSFNLIITTIEGPIILCSEKPTFNALSSNSPIWPILFSHLLNPHPNSCLDLALLSALSIRAQEKTLSSVLFLFTDGNFSSKQLKVNNSILERIVSYNVEAVTVGIGSFSSNINSLETKKAWSINPRNIIKSILAAFGKETNDLIPKIPSLYTDIPFDKTDLIAKLSNYLKFNSIDDYTFKELIIELNNITRDISVFKDFYNIQPDGKEELMEDESHDIGKMNFYKGIKILICQFWDRSMSRSEDPRVSKDVLINGIDENKRSVINSLNEFGIETNIVQNYRSAISEIRSGEYSEVWVICGRHDGRMPDNSEWANLSSQFTEVLIIYWESGGGIVFWTDNSPLTAEVNFFLNRANFSDDENKEYKVNFRIGGSYRGEQMLQRSEKPRVQSFVATQTIQCDGYQKLLFNANMKNIYEGITIASAIIPPENARSQCYDDSNENYQFAYSKDILPFRYFSISSDRGISSLYYTSSLNSKKGDIVIDCGFSKLFFELNTEGIYWYVRNIAIFMISIEKKTSMIGGTPDPRKFKPKPFNYNLKPYVKPEPSFYHYNEERAVDIVFLIDGTGSMRFFIDAVVSSCNEIAEYCNKNFSDNSFRFGCVIYRDNAVRALRNKYAKYAYKNYSDDETEVSSLKPNINDLADFLSKVEAKGGGGDGPEDWLSGYQRLKRMNWKPASKKIVIHIADAPGHGKSFNSGNYSIPHYGDGEQIDKNEYEEMDEEHNNEFPDFIKWAAGFGIKFYGLSGSYSAYKSFEETERIYKKNGGSQFKITQFDNYDADNINDKQKKQIIKIVKKIAKESVDDATAVPTQNNEVRHQDKNQSEPGYPLPFQNQNQHNRSQMNLNQPPHPNRRESSNATRQRRHLHFRYDHEHDMFNDDNNDDDDDEDQSRRPRRRQNWHKKK